MIIVCKQRNLNIEYGAAGEILNLYFRRNNQ